MKHKTRSVQFFLAATILLSIIGAALYIARQGLPYRPVDLLLLIGLFPVGIALRNVDNQATYGQALIDPINLAILLGCGSFTAILLLAIDTSAGRVLSLALALLPAYGMLVWLTQRIAVTMGGFGLFNIALALFFLPVLLDDSSLAAWNVLAPTWVDVALVGPTTKSVALIAVYLAGGMIIKHSAHGASKE